ncbi:peritrophin-1-like [Drosophila hydei]|uniref:Peritrophin-1-like n=1 Tax=Drosophila hydei TaxID=7224 RepID=A0A6J1LUA1_DROHY|nr:peritrophin-1-like [Drosophila hydei]
MKTFIVVLLLAGAIRAQNLRDQCRGIQYDLLPHPDTNEKFIVCAYEVAEVRTCDKEEQEQKCFDPIQKACSVASCTATKPADEDIAKEICKSMGQSERIPSVDCNHFWICLAHMEPVYVTCPQGKHFSRSEQECISPALAKCQAPEKLCTSNLSSYAAENCNEFYGCTDNKLVKRSCAYGEAYSAVAGSCVKDINNSCRIYTKPDCENPANANAYFAHSDCSRFYICVLNQVYEGKCADGYGFDSVSSNCKYGIC